MLHFFWVQLATTYICQTLIIPETQTKSEIWLGAVVSMQYKMHTPPSNVIEIVNKHKTFISLKYPQDIHLVEILQ